MLTDACTWAGVGSETKVDHDDLLRIVPVVSLIPRHTMSKTQSDEEKEAQRAATIVALENKVLVESSRGKVKWPVEIKALNQTAYLRLEAEKNRIMFDWQVPKEYRGSLKKTRIKNQIPAPEKPVARAEDRGHNVHLAAAWALAELKRLVIAAENGGTDDPADRPLLVPGAVANIGRLIGHWKRSEDFLTKGSETRQQYEKWTDFLEQVYPGTEFPANRIDARVPREVVRVAQLDWNRRHADGKVRKADGLGHNTAVKVSELLRRIVTYAMTVVIGSDEKGEPVYLLAADPYIRIPPKYIPKQMASRSRPKGTATDEYAQKFCEALSDPCVTRSPQARVIVEIERRTGRRIGEGRNMARSSYLKTAEEIEAALWKMECRVAFQDKHLRAEDIPATARAYAECGGAILFSKEFVKQVNQARSRADERGFDERRYDCVVPIGKNLASIIDAYISEYWIPLGLPDSAPLFPAQRKSRKGHTAGSRATPKCSVETWTEKACAVIARELGERMPEGKTHPLRGRARSRLKDHGVYASTVGFYSAWSSLTGLAMDDHYAHITPAELLKVAAILDAD
jgi:hypothetical protein